MNRSLLMKATSSDDNPTPGYLYGEIAKLTHAGSDVVDKVVKLLMTRLKGKDPNVKLKCLNVIKQVCRKGHQSFRRVIQTSGETATVKSCLQFTGPADPLKGDQPYRAVRDAAKDALEAIFDNTTEVTASDSALAQRIKGYGGGPTEIQNNGGAGSSYDNEYSNNYSSGSSYPSTYSGGRGLPSESSGMSYSSSGRGGSRYEGIGNPNFKDPRNQPKGFMDRVKDRLEEYSDKASKTVATSGIQDWLGKSGGSGGAGTGGYNYSSNRGGGGGGAIHNPYAPQQSSNIGAYQGANIAHSSGSFSSPSQNRWGPPTTTIDPRSPRQQAQTQPSYVSRASSSSDGNYERGLLDELCSRGGVRAVPAREKLNRFVNACKTLEASIVMPILYEKLESSDWKVAHKGLCVCEAFLQGGEEYELYVDYLDEHAEILERLQSSSQPTLRNRCKKVWVLLYGEEEVVSSVPAPEAAPATPAPSSPGVSLLDFDGGEEPGPPREKNEEAAAQSASPNMFGNMQVKAAAPAASVAAQSNDDSIDLMGGDPVLEQKPPQPPPSGGDIASQLAGLSFSESDPVSSTKTTAKTGFSFISATAAPAANNNPVINIPQNPDNVGSAFDSLVQNNIGVRKNPIPTQPNAYAARMMSPQFQQPPLQQQQQILQMQQQAGLMQMQMQQASGGFPTPMQMPNQMYVPNLQPRLHHQHSSSSLGGGTPQKTSPKASTKQPDKFDFVSSAMAQMK